MGSARTILVLIALVAQAASAGDESLFPDFSSYPKSKAFQIFISRLSRTIPVRDAADFQQNTNLINRGSVINIASSNKVVLPFWPTSKQKVVLSVWIFPGHGPHDVAGEETYYVEGMNYEAMEKGMVDKNYECWWSTGNANTTNGNWNGDTRMGGMKFLNQNEMEELRFLIESLHEENSAPPIEQLAIISYASGTNWVTRTCNRSDFTPEMRKISKLVGPEIAISK